MAIDQGLIAAARVALAASADPQRAPAMQRYMKSALPYYGVPSAGVRAAARGLIAAHPLAERADWDDTIRALYDGARYREERYVALEVAGHRRYSVFRDPSSVELWRHLIVTGAWWDLVDTLAAHRVGEVLSRYPQAVRPVIWSWATDDDLWLRRTALICQLSFGSDTDLALLTYAVDANVEGTRYGSEFFVRKAIGWALRQYARTEPDWVRAFVAERAGVLSGLSRREALKHL